MVVTAAATVRGFAADRAACRGLFPSGLAACGGLFPSPPLPETEAAPQTPCRGCAPDSVPGLRPRLRAGAAPQTPCRGCAPDSVPGLRPRPGRGFRPSPLGGVSLRVLDGGLSSGFGRGFQALGGGSPQTSGRGSAPDPGRGLQAALSGGSPQPPGWDSAPFRGIGMRLRRGAGLRPGSGSRGGAHGYGKGRGGERTAGHPPYPKDGLRGGRGGALACVGRPKARDDADGLRPHRGREPGRRGRSLEALGKGVPLRQRRRAVSPNRTTTTPDRSRCGRA